MNITLPSNRTTFTPMFIYVHHSKIILSFGNYSYSTMLGFTQVRSNSANSSEYLTHILTFLLVDIRFYYILPPNIEYPHHFALLLFLLR